MQTEKKTRKTSDLIKVKQLIRICEKSSVCKIKYDNIELEFREKLSGKAKKADLVIEKDKSNQYLDKPAVDMPPDDVMLFAATDHFDDMLNTRSKASKGK